MDLTGAEIAGAISFITAPMGGAVVKLWLETKSQKEEIQKLNDRLLAEKEARRLDVAAAAAAVDKLGEQITKLLAARGGSA